MCECLCCFAPFPCVLGPASSLPGKHHTLLHIHSLPCCRYSFGVMMWELCHGMLAWNQVRGGYPTQHLNRTSIQPCLLSALCPDTEPLHLYKKLLAFPFSTCT